jgi:hypothetical protein
MKVVNLLIGTTLAGVSLSLAVGAELQPATLKAWDEYIRTADSRMQSRLEAGQPFLWTDESPDRELRVRRGEIVVAPVSGKGTEEVPNGLIHDWIGAAFLPHATIESLLAVVHDYDRYKDVYKPVVINSKTIATSAADEEFSMTWERRVLFVTAAIEGQYRAHDFAVDAHRGYNIANTTRVQEIEDYGHAAERLLPPDRGNGFIWRMYSIARYEERDGGVYLELEAIALTRDVPGSLRWLVNPVINKLSVRSLTTTLRQTRLAVDALPARPQSLAMSRAPKGVE